MQLLTLATALTLLAQATASGAALGRRHSIDGYLRENENLIERGAGMVERSANLSARAESTQWKRTPFFAHADTRNDLFYAATIDEPNGGNAYYVSLETAQANIINTTRTDAADARNPSGRIFGFKPWMKGVPDKNNSPPGVNYNRGIPSLRFHSIQNFEGNFMLVARFPNMFGMWGAWPAFWTVGGDWPYGGEIDIIEGANVKGPNKMTINVRNGCTFTYARDSMAGTGEKCNTRSHTWCSVAAKNDYTAQGYYVMRRNQESMAIWYFAGNDLPGSLAKAGTAEGAGVLDETTFGKPAALFKFNSDCRTSDFGPQGIVRNIALCARYVKSNNAADRPDAMDRDCEAYMNTWDWASKARWGTPAYEVDFIEAYENA